METSATLGRENQVGSPENILRRAGSVPEYTTFPPMDELTARFEKLRGEHPQLISVQRIGASRLGDALEMYSIGDGPLSHLVVGGVHPNEPIGAWTALHLLEQLATDDDLRTGLGARWNIVPCIDPDGTRLNEGWFANPGDRGSYARAFYRPAPNEQVEWTFPFSYKKAYFDAMMPETQALARAIDLTKPDLYVALHNAEMGGVYYYLTRDVPELYDLLAAVPESLGLPLDKGEPEGGHLKELAQAIFITGSLEEVYDWVESLGGDPFPPGSGGNASSDYALRYGTLSLIAELPYWKHPDADNTAPTDESYSALLARTGAVFLDFGTELIELLAEAEPLLTIDTPFLRGSRAFVPMMKATGESNIARSRQPEAQRPATVAERFGCEDLVHMFRLRFGGMLLRAFEAEVNAGTAPAELRRITERMLSLYTGWQREAADDDNAEVIPISSLVGVQYGAILAGAAYFAGTLT
ncbi:M14 family zinc carboxypeptidase [Mycetocola zhujimingii]|uniref:M14 family zinc carboxypeptidase n=1 Tax=Mycetocola zhujimingii TaxID=2079792 RepID=UPI001F377200|nr:M14 family zinc carboxypeptidase [Mycetocola zhujimingii]